MKRIFLASIGCLLAATVFSQQKIYIYCGQLIDGVANQSQPEMTIILSGNKISEVQRGYTLAPADARLIDLKNRTVLPGLMDMHVHLEHEQSRTSYLEGFTQNEAYKSFIALKNGQKTLDAGFTTVRDLGGGGANLALRDAINNGLVQGPRIFTAGHMISITGGHGDGANGSKEDLWEAPGMGEGVADGPDECRKAVRRQIKRGADCIKIAATGGVLSLARDGKRPAFTEEEMKAVMETAGLNIFYLAICTAKIEMTAISCAHASD